MFEYNEEGALTPLHHPFTMPKNLDVSNPTAALSLSYDVVLNGVELGGAAICAVIKSLMSWDQSR